MTSKRRSGREWIILLFFLPLGIAAMFYAGQAAISQPPIWKVKAKMGSYLDPNSYFSSTPDIVEPLSNAILTQPAWADTFLTPGGYTGDNTPPPLATATQQNPGPATPTASILPTNSPVPTNTTYYLPPTNTPIPPPPTNTSIPPTATDTSTPLPPTATNTPVPSVDLSISKNDGSATYTAGDSTTYTIIVSNNGPDGIVGAQINDNLPAQITSWDWVCTNVTNASGCDAVAGSSTNFTDTVDIQNGGSITYTVKAYISADASGDLVNTATVSGGTDSNLANNTSNDTDTLQRIADLAISKNAPTDVYEPNDLIITYTVVVSNNGPSDIANAQISDDLPSQITSWDWTCTNVTNASGCDPVIASTSNFSDTVDIQNGGSITYTVTANISGTATGNLVNTATVSVPAGANDPNSGNNSSSYTHQRVYDLPYDEIGETADGVIYPLSEGDSLVFNVTIIVDGNNSDDEFVYYELPSGSCGGIIMDFVIISIGNGNTWYEVFNWGNGSATDNAHIPSSYLPELDTREVCGADLYNNTGVSINVDASAPLGTYSYIRIYAPIDGNDHVLEVDAIETLP